MPADAASRRLEFGSTEPSIGKGSRPVAPTRSGRALSVRLRRSFRPSAAAQRGARATLDTFDSPQLARTIVTRPKSRASTRSSPPACRRRSGPRPGRALPAQRGCQFERPAPNADSRGLRDPRRLCRLWGSSPSAASPSSVYRVLTVRKGGGIWVGLLSPTSWGAFVLSCKDFRPALGYRRRTGACTPDFAYRTRVPIPRIVTRVR